MLYFNTYNSTSIIIEKCACHGDDTLCICFRTLNVGVTHHASLPTRHRAAACHSLALPATPHCCPSSSVLLCTRSCHGRWLCSTAATVMSSVRCTVDAARTCAGWVRVGDVPLLCEMGCAVGTSIDAVLDSAQRGCGVYTACSCWCARPVVFKGGQCSRTRVHQWCANDHAPHT